MELSDLKTMPVQELNSLGESSGLENVSGMKRQDLIFSILKNKAKEGQDIEGGGVLEILQDGFGFLRSPSSSYLAGPDDIYVSHSQIKKYGLKSGDTITGNVRPPKVCKPLGLLARIRLPAPAANIVTSTCIY